MLSLLVTTTLALGFVDSTAPDDASAELARLAEQLAKVESYQFTSSMTTDGGLSPAGAPGGADAPRRGRGGQGQGQGAGKGAGQGAGQGAGAGGAGGRGNARAGGAPQPTSVEGVWKSGLPMEIKVGDAVAYKAGDRIVYTDAEGTWKRFEMPTRGADGAGAPGRGGDRGRGGARGGERGRGDAGGETGRGGERPEGAGGADRESMRALRSAAGAVAPHEQFQGFAALVSDVERSTVAARPAAEGGDAVKPTPTKTLYKGKLTEAGVAALGGRGGFAGRGGAGAQGGATGGAGRGGRGGAGMQMETSGTFTIEVVGGAITSAEFVIVRSGSFGDREFERTSTQTSTFSNAGKAKLEVPANALELLKL